MPVAGPVPGGHDARRSDRGFVTVWTVGVSTACIALVGLVFDGGLALRERSDAFGVAAAAARAGAQEVDEHAAVQGELHLDEAAAQEAAVDHAAAAGYHAEVEIADLDITVTISGETDFEILPGSAAYTVSATAQVTVGSGT
jgi:Flp pilus assembly protein TadG